MQGDDASSPTNLAALRGAAVRRTAVRGVGSCASGLWQERGAGALSEEEWMGGDLRSRFVRFSKNSVKIFHWTLLLAEFHLPTCRLFPVMLKHLLCYKLELFSLPIVHC